MLRTGLLLFYIYQKEECRTMLLSLDNIMKMEKYQIFTPNSLLVMVILEVWM
jgi:hypothetical protein